MTLEAAKLAAANNLWGAILPELMLAGVALLLLALEILLPRRQHAILPDLAGAGILGTLLGLCFNWDSGMLGSETFGGLLYHSTSGQLLRAFFLIAAFLTCVIARITLARQKMPRVEFYHLLLICTAAMMLLAQTNHLLMLFVTLEPRLARGGPEVRVDGGAELGPAALWDHVVVRRGGQPVARRPRGAALPLR
jgi:NADH-quinone oxidoreductase subunit N